MALRRSAAVLAGAMALLAACGGGDGRSNDSTTATSAAEADDSTPTTGETERSTSTTGTPTTIAPTTTVDARREVGSASTIQSAVDLRLLDKVEFSPLDGAEDVAIGDVVRTDATGYAEIAYFDGSRTRLDVDTEFEIVELVDDPGESAVRTRMGLGRTWHRVESLGEGEYSVETSVGVATVVGTAFSIECEPDRCRFVVVDGIVDVALADGSSVRLTAPAALEVTDAGAAEPVPAPFDAAFSDPWLLDNSDRDVAAGFADRAALYEAHGPAFGSMTGTFTGTRTVVERTCVASCSGTAEVGDVADRTYTFDVDCSAGVPCTGTVIVEFLLNNVRQTQAVPLTFDGVTYRWTFERELPGCIERAADGSTVETGSVTVVFTYEATPTAGRQAEGAWEVAAWEGTATAVNTVNDHGNCPPTNQGETERSMISVSR